ncbi:MAG TPA: response regulator [Candidatus Kapabacteria bacterium]|jgi:CheY-like chemotaxis protein|nr:response regulator [Candidatus Kapabacteria bacterium]HPU23847.1 response regulator [Candidatus Kapabacteria bacterium]
MAKETGELANVLVIDDSDTYRMMMKKVIELYFYANVHLAENPGEAFEMIPKISPDLIILDMQMPVMDGFTALKNIRSIDGTKDIPVVAFTALSTSTLVAELVKWKINDFIKKPTTTEIIVKKLKPFLPLKRDIGL